MIYRQRSEVRTYEMSSMHRVESVNVYNYRPGVDASAVTDPASALLLPTRFLSSRTHGDKPDRSRDCGRQHMHSRCIVTIIV